MSGPEQTRTSFLMRERTHKVFREYRRLSIQLTAKAVTSVPYMVLWVLWICNLKILKQDGSTFLYTFVLSGSIISYTWLVASSFFNLRFTLEVWSYFSIIWSLPTMIGVLQLVSVREYLLGCVLMAIGLLSLFDGLISTTFRVPLPKRVVEVAVRKRTLNLPYIPKFEPEGDMFVLIPLDGSSWIPLSEFPQMSTPSTSSQAFVSASGEEDNEQTVRFDTVEMLKKIENNDNNFL